MLVSLKTYRNFATDEPKHLPSSILLAFVRQRKTAKQTSFPGFLEAKARAFCFFRSSLVVVGALSAQVGLLLFWVAFLVWLVLRWLCTSGSTMAMYASTR